MQVGGLRGGDAVAEFLAGPGEVARARGDGGVVGGGGARVDEAGIGGGLRDERGADHAAGSVAKERAFGGGGEGGPADGPDKGGIETAEEEGEDGEQTEGLEDGCHGGIFNHGEHGGHGAREWAGFV